MRRKRMRRLCAKTYRYKLKRWLLAKEASAAWEAQEDARVATFYSLHGEEQDTFVIKGEFSLWKDIVETGCKPDMYGQSKVDDDEKLLATAYLGFRPNHPQTVKYRRWFKRLAKKQNIYLLFCDAAENHFYWNGDDAFSMAEYNTILKGLKRFIKANKLYKIEGIRKGYAAIKSQFHRPRLYRKDYRQYMRVWHTLADSED